MESPANAAPPKEPPVAGTWVEMGGKSYLVPPLNFKGLRQVEEDLKVLASIKLEGGALPSDDQVKSLCKVIKASIVRNYPNVTLEELEDLVDFGNLPQLILAVMKASGLVQKEGAPGKPAGA